MSKGFLIGAFVADLHSGPLDGISDGEGAGACFPHPATSRRRACNSACWASAGRFFGRHGALTASCGDVLRTASHAGEVDRSFRALLVDRHATRPPRAPILLDSCAPAAAAVRRDGLRGWKEGREVSVAYCWRVRED